MNEDDFEVPDTPEDLINKHGGIEPAAGWRQNAMRTREYYVSLVQAGFSEAQAMDLVKVIVQVAVEHGLRRDRGR